MHKKEEIMGEIFYSSALVGMTRKGVSTETEVRNLK